MRREAPARTKKGHLHTKEPGQRRRGRRKMPPAGCNLQLSLRESTVRKQKGRGRTAEGRRSGREKETIKWRRRIFADSRPRVGGEYLWGKGIPNRSPRKRRKGLKKSRSGVVDGREEDSQALRPNETHIRMCRKGHTGGKKDETLKRGAKVDL